MKVEIENETDDVLTIIIEPYCTHYEISPRKIATLIDDMKECSVVYTSKNIISVYASLFSEVFVDGSLIEPV